MLLLPMRRVVVASPSYDHSPIQPLSLVVLAKVLPD